MGVKMNEIHVENSMERSVAFLTLGCKVNSYETNAMEKLFLESGYEIKEFSKKAQVYVINTCTVTNMADRKSRQMIHRAKKINPQGVVVAVGCYVQAAKDEIELDPAIDIVIGNNQKNQIVSMVEQYLSGNSVEEKIMDVNQTDFFEELSIESSGEQTRAYIKIQDGCNQFCSYCIIPYVRGRIRSRQAQEIIAEVQRLRDRGYKEVVLTGIHLSSYGVDFLEDNDFVKAAGKPLLDLIKEINQVEGIQRIRLGSLEPRIITQEFADELSKSEKFCPHFHLSLQSGCNETLQRMNRKYTAEEYYEKCQILRKNFKDPAITTDVIVGFPGETEEEYEKTKAFLEKVAFSDMHIFKYSKRKGTQAADMDTQVPDTEKHRRSEELIKLAKKMNGNYKQLFMGKKEKVLIEELVQIDGKEYQVGHNERYLKIAISNEERHANHANDILNVTIKEDLNSEIMLAISDGLY